jgi:hypothetical protein
VQNRPLVVGKVAGDVKLKADGKADKIEGEVRNAVGGLKDTLKGKLGVVAACFVARSWTLCLVGQSVQFCSDATRDACLVCMILEAYPSVVSIAQFKESPMSRIRFYLTAVVFTAVMSSGAVVAQTPVSPPANKSPPAASAPDSSKPSAVTQVEAWTSTQWEAAKEEWAKDKAKWADCQEQSSKQKLEGRKSWSFLYTCMTS